MTVKQSLNKYSTLDETELFLSHLLKFSKKDLFLNPNQELTKNQQIHLQKMVQDFKKGRPAAYILGHKYFFGLKFKVSPQVLIPRPESEWLVKTALKFLSKNKTKQIQVLDLGTGSGALAITIAKYSNLNVKVIASDISSSALKIAQLNAQANSVTIKFIQSDLLSKINQNLQLIIANLPYVPVSDYNKLFEGLKFEPKLALTDGTNEFILYRRFIEQLANKKLLPKLVLFEIDPTTKPVLIKLVKEFLPNSKLTFEKDLQKLWRYAILKN